MSLCKGFINPLLNFLQPIYKIAGRKLNIRRNMRSLGQRHYSLAAIFAIVPLQNMKDAKSCKNPSLRNGQSTA